MTSNVIMFDSVDDAQFPRGAQAYAGYLDGQIASQPNYSWIVAEFPNAFHLSITLNADEDADALDIENGAATPQQAAGWWQRQRNRGLQRPCLYASASVMQASIVPLIRAGTIARPLVRLWSAHYAGQHICSPSSCGAVSIAMDGTQWTPNAWGRDLDESLLLADFFGTPPAPKPAPPSVPAWQETMMNKLPTLSEGAEDKAGEVFYVHRLQALVHLYGQITGLADAVCQMVTGNYDAATAACVRAVQGHARITPDGVAGKDTWSVLITGSAS